ncbi:MAG TPA: response regulator transcription factor [Acidimicrobiales bacterium]|nr:response regulator transcription factor [Acidimicrobiales bacterium]
MTRVLVVDDDASLRKALQIGLTARGYDVLLARSGEEGVSQVALAAPDIVVLDLGLPDIDGLDVCRRVRSWSNVPIVVLSAAGSESRKVAALDEGADDYVTKPFSMGELEARLRTALRHAAGVAAAEPTEIRVGRVSLDLMRRSATLDDRPVDLTPHEFSYLSYLARHAGKVCTHQMILQAVWGPGYGGQTRYVRVYAHRLRHKLGDTKGRMLRNHPGIGYEFVAD